MRKLLKSIKNGIILIGFKLSQFSKWLDQTSKEALKHSLIYKAESYEKLLDKTYEEKTTQSKIEALEQIKNIYLELAEDDSLYLRKFNTYRDRIRKLEQSRYTTKKTIYQGGQIRQLFSYKDNYKHGKCKGWYKNGNLRYTINFHNNLPLGSFEIFDSSKELICAGIFKKKEYECNIYKDETLISQLISEKNKITYIVSIQNKTVICWKVSKRKFYRIKNKTGRLTFSGLPLWDKIVFLKSVRLINVFKIAYSDSIKGTDYINNTFSYIERAADEFQLCCNENLAPSIDLDSHQEAGKTKAAVGALVNNRKQCNSQSGKEDLSDTTRFQEYLSTSKIARLHKIKGTKSVFNYLTEYGLVIKDNNKYHLTEKGEGIGGQYMTTKDKAKFIAWPKNALLPIIKKYQERLFKHATIKNLQHITHLKNLPNIHQYGLKAHENPHKVVDISNNEVNKLREKEEPIFGRKLHQYVPFYLNSKNPMLYSAQKRFNEDIIIICVNENILLSAESLISNKNAAVSNARYFKYIDEWTSIDWQGILNKKWHINGTNNTSLKQSMMAEALIYDNVPSKNIRMILVQSEDIKKKVLTLLPNINAVVKVSPDSFFKV